MKSICLFMYLSLVSTNRYCFIDHYFIKFQQTHQKNQIKDSIDVDEPEGT